MSQDFDTLNASSDSAADFPSQTWNTFRDSSLTAHSGSSRPAYAQKGTLWLNSSDDTFYVYDGAADIPVYGIDAIQHWKKEPMGGGMTTRVTGDTTDIGATQDNLIFLTGSTTISDFGASSLPGQVKVCVANSSFQITHNSLSLFLPGSTNIITSPGDCFGVICTSPGKYKILFYTVAATAVSGFSTGDVKLTFKSVADSGWVMCDDGTIGSTSSGATSRSNDDTQALYVLIWNGVSDTYAPVIGGRGGSALADFAANKPISLTKMLGRVLGLSGNGSGLTARSLGQYLGEENHALTSGENAAHNHSVTDPGHTHDVMYNSGGTGPYNTTGNNLTSGGVTSATRGGSYPYLGLSSNASNVTINSSGSGTPHNTMQPTVFLNAMIKL